MNQERKSAELLQIGIQHKRNGDLEQALHYYQKAFYEYPFNKDIYKNCAKIYMSIGQPDHAMRNLLAHAHLVLHGGNVNMESYDFAVPFYDWSGELSEFWTIQKDVAIKAVAADMNLAKIVAELNLTFQAGFTFILKNRNGITRFQIPANLLNNYIKALLGQQVDGPSIADTNGASMVRAIGLSYLLRNLLTNRDLSMEEAIDAYLSEEFEVENI